MPEISLFYGIRVTMYYDDHIPPHFHAEYNGNKAIIKIDEARVIKGALPSFLADYIKQRAGITASYKSDKSNWWK